MNVDPAEGVDCKFLPALLHPNSRVSISSPWPLPIGFLAVPEDTSSPDWAIPGGLRPDCEKIDDPAVPFGNASVANKEWGLLFSYCQKCIAKVKR